MRVRKKFLPIMNKKVKNKRWWIIFRKPLFQRSLMSNGMMLPASIKLNKHWRKQSLCQCVSHKFLLGQENLGKEFYCMVLQEQGKLSLRRHAHQKWMGAHFSVWAVATLWANTWEKARRSWNVCSKWQERKNRALSSLTKLIPWLETEAMAKINPVEGSRQNS